MSGKTLPSVLVLGGCGFIGRNLVTYLVKSKTVSFVRVVDKVPPATAWLNEAQKEVFYSPMVEFLSANLIIPESCDNAFSGGNFDFVVNLAAETRPNKSDAVYQEGIVKVTQNCATRAALMGVKAYIELSTGHMASSDKVPHAESDESNPWSYLGKYKLLSEQFLETVPSLNYIVIRPALVYGIGDRTGLVPRLIMGLIYRELGKTMKLLWTKDLKMNTVHVEDLCRAIWFLCQNGKAGQVYNVVDKGDSDQGRITECVAEIFGVSYEFVGTTLSNIAKTDLESLLEDINDQHLEPWARLCSASGVLNTPLDPYLHPGVLSNKNLYLNGKKLEDLGFEFKYPTLTAESLKTVLSDYTNCKLFPEV